MKGGRVEQEKRVVESMVRIYCRGRGHGQGRGRELCGDCRALLEYSLLRLESCPFGEGKPFCSVCRVHCYGSYMRERIIGVMRFAGPRMVFYHPLLALRHLFVRKR